MRMTITIEIPQHLQLWLLKHYILTPHGYLPNKVEAIKKVRAETNCGLKEAKDFVDGLEAQLRATWAVIENDPRIPVYYRA